MQCYKCRKYITFSDNKVIQPITVLTIKQEDYWGMNLTDNYTIGLCPDCDSKFIDWINSKDEELKNNE